MTETSVPRAAVAMLTAMESGNFGAMRAVCDDIDTRNLAFLLGDWFLDFVHFHEGDAGIARVFHALGQRYAGDDHCPCCCAPEQDDDEQETP